MRLVQSVSTFRRSNLFTKVMQQKRLLARDSPSNKTVVPTSDSVKEKQPILSVPVEDVHHKQVYPDDIQTERLDVKRFYDTGQPGVDPTTVENIFYFDTLAFSKRLEEKGFTREQADVCTQCFVEVINSTLVHQSKHMISKSQQKIAIQQLMSEIQSVKKDMVLLQKSEFSSLRTETEKLSIEMSRMSTHLNDEVLKLKGQFSLDINLERGRAIEAHADNEKKLQQLHNKIDTEVANLKTVYEMYRNDVFKYTAVTILSCASLAVAVIRLWT